MEPEEVAVTESEAEVMGPVGVGWVLEFEEPPPDEPEEEDAAVEPQPGRREDAARASAP
jgi:hypothetical protein